MSVTFALMLLAAPDPAPTDVRIETFAVACIPHRQDLAAATAAMPAAGWAPVADDDHPELATTMATARAGMTDPELEMTAEVSVWGRTVEGRRLYVMLSRVEVMIGQTGDRDGDGVLQDWETAKPFIQIGCGLWDFDASEPIDPAAMSAWTRSEPVQVVDAPGVITGGTWNVYDRYPGTAEIHLGFIPEGSSVALTGFSGVAITMSSAPEEDEPGAD